MADAVEAASRSLKEYNEASIRGLVEKIIDTQLEEGYFRLSPLTFRDIQTVKEVFVDKLLTVYHTRIAYRSLSSRCHRNSRNNPTRAPTPPCLTPAVPHSRRITHLLVNLLPLDGRGRLGRDIVHHAIYPLHLMDNLVGDRRQEVVRQVNPVGRHGIDGAHGARRWCTRRCVRHP